MERQVHDIPQSDRQILNIIHDIRSPLTAIRLAHMQLQDEIKTAGYTDSNALEELNGIINRNIARIELQLHQVLGSTNEKSEKHARYDIARIIDSAIHKAKDRIFLHGVRVQQNYMPGHFILGNAEELISGFLNVILNSVEAVRPNEGQLWIAVYEVDANIKVVFKDNGRGMTSDTLSKIFDLRFSTKSDGLGIGLFYLKKILDQHQATITVMSEPDIGTTVIIMFGKHTNMPA